MANYFTLAFSGISWLVIARAAIGVAHCDAPANDGQQIAVSDALPAWESIDDAANVWRSTDHIGRKVVVLYFYPGDFTDGCAKQAREYREGLTRLEGLGVEVVGISGDEVKTHQLFKQTHNLSHILLADPDGTLAGSLGIPVQRPARPAKVRTRDLAGQPLMDEQGKSIFIERNVTLPRWTLIVGRDGTLISKRINVDPAKDADEVITLVEMLLK